MQALADIHFTPGFTRDFSPAIKRSHLNLLLIVGLLLFAVATFNFLIMNLARSEKRLHKTRILQFLGGTNYSIFKNYTIEILFLVIPALILAVLLIQLLNPLLTTSFFNGWSVQIGTPVFWLILTSLGLIIVVTSSLASTSFLLKQKLTTENKKAVSLIIFQFVVVIAITTFGILVNKQINYIHKADLGYSPENIMIFKVPNNTTVNISVFKEKAITVPGVIAVGSAQQYPGFRIQDTYITRPEDTYPSKFIRVDRDAMHTLGVNIIDTLLVSEGLNFYLNETLFKALLKENSLEELSSDKNESREKDNPANINFTINGVVQDFHYASFYNPIENFMFLVENRANYRFLLVRYNLQNTASVKSELKTIAASIYNCDIDPLFLDEQLNLEYQSEEQLLSITKMFILLTILIAGMGLFAFSLYSTQRRTKEIGIHKVNGAKVLEILALLNKNFIQWVIIAFIIATPIAYFVMNKWLQNFAYKTELSWWVFALAGCIAIVIALLTVSWQTIRAARRNPVESLRYE